jgi:5-methylcytosine-specific restriction endonuclease McrA
MNDFVECGICYAPTKKQELYCYGVPSLKKVGLFWHGSLACLECQESWIKRHTVVCCDCGSTYVTVNVGVAKRCDQCRIAYNSKVNAVSVEKKRARDKGLSSTMNRSDWIVTLSHFDYRCAYCGDEYKVIEHFTPVKFGGGTNASNCVPACAKCNQSKKTIDGHTQQEQLARRLNIPLDRIYAIAQYLDSR